MSLELIDYGFEVLKQSPTEIMTAVGTSVFLMSFSYGVRKAIKRRDGKCMNEGARHCGKLEAAHYNHDRTSPDYDSMDNGRALCTNCHLEDHILREGENGLSKKHNDSAISALKERLRMHINYREDTK